MTIAYDPRDSSTFAGLLQLLFRYQGTMLPLVFGRASFWMLLTVHLVLSSSELLVRKSMLHTPFPDVDWNVIKTVTALLTFFIVFYTSQCYSRFVEFYKACVGIGGVVMSWAGLIKVYMPDDNDVRWQIMRLPLASMYVLYYSVNSTKDRTGATEENISEDEWNGMRSHQLLTESEIKALQTYGGARHFLPMTWALAEVESVLAAVPPADFGGGDDGPACTSVVPNSEHAKAAVLNTFRTLTLEMRGYCGHITQFLKQPVPFPYFQFLVVLIGIDLFLISYGLTTLDFHWLLTLFIYVVIQTAFLGLKEVAVAMSDPFGDDDVDFDANAMLQEAYNNALACLRDRRAPTAAKTKLPKELSNPLNPPGKGGNGSGAAYLRGLSMKGLGARTYEVKDGGSILGALAEGVESVALGVASSPSYLRQTLSWGKTDGAPSSAPSRRPQAMSWSRDAQAPHSPQAPYSPQFPDPPQPPDRFGRAPSIIGKGKGAEIL